jgi:predicted AAA+ superfamily ATPase
MKDIIGTLLYEWKQKALPETLGREVELSSYVGLRPKKIVVVTGFRRAGKTYVLYSLLKELMKKMGREEAVYMNFEDERIPLETGFLTILLPSIKQFFGAELKMLFLDEVHNVPQWSKWLRRIYDAGDIEIFVSGSSSKMSSKEIPTELRGRFLEVVVFPLSFREFLAFRRLQFDLKALPYSEDEKAKLLRALSEYLTYGGLPEIVLAEESRKNEIANSYYQTVVRRDIIERNKVKNEEAMKALVRLLLNSTHYSISKLYDTLKSLGYPVGKNTLQNYLGYVENSYFAFSTPIFSYKVKDRLHHPRKIHFIDNVFINLFSTKFSRNYGRLYENLVAVELKRRMRPEGELCYWKSEGTEVDFALVQDGKVERLIQVCYDVSDIRTKERETRALIKAGKELGCSQLLVITEDYAGEETVSWFGARGRIVFVPLWKWLLQPDER